MADDHRASPDIVLLGVEWQPRALLRAQLIEEGFDVRGADTWPMLVQYLRPDSGPRLVIVDLPGLPHATSVLTDLRARMRPDRVIVLCGLGSPTAEQVEALGFRVMRRPIHIAQVVSAATTLLKTAA
jgi:DNA-binding response OmpR family regulator